MGTPRGRNPFVEELEVSLGSTIIREPGDEIDASVAVVYRAFIESLDRPSRTTPERAILRAARRTGVPRERVLQIVRSLNDQEV